MSENISDRQKEYLYKIRNQIDGQCKNIYIYGAGQMGRNLSKILERNGIKVTSFCVTNAKINPKVVDGVPVRTLSEIKDDKEKIILLAALPPTNEEMIISLDRYGIHEYIDVEKDMRHILDEVCLRPTLEITSRIGCSVNCKLCPQKVLMNVYDKKNKDVMLKFETFKKCIDKTPKKLIVDFAGYAEPFLNPEILTMMKYAMGKGHDVRLYTTLVGMTEDVFREVLNLPFYNVVLHLPDSQGYSNIPLTKEYYGFLERILLAKRIDGRPFVDKANGQGRPHPSIIPYIEHNVTMHQVLIDWAGNIESNEVESSYVKKGRLICEYSINLDHNVLLPDGTVVLCCMDWGNTCVLGNLLNDSYEEIVSGHSKEAILSELNSITGDEHFLCRKCTNAIEI